MREIFHVLFTGKNHRISARNFKDLRARAVLGNRCSIRLSYGTNSKKRVFRRVRRHKIQIAALYSIRCPAETSVLSGNAPDTARAMIAMI